MKIIAAIPCFDEERFVGSVVTKARKFVDCVIVIDDGSTDGTAEVASGAGAVVYRHEDNQGYGAAIRTAFEKGRQLGADVLVVLDGDGQHEPKDIPQVIGPVLNGEADIVVGSRFLGDGKRPPFLRRLGQRVLNAATNLGSGLRLSDSQSGFRAYSSKALRLLNLAENGMSIASEMQFAIGESGLKTVEVPITVSYAGKAKRNAVKHGTAVLARVIVLFALRQPLLLFGMPGVVLLGGGLALGARVFTLYSETHELAVGNALGTILLCLAGLLAVFAALMLQAIKELLRTVISQVAKDARQYTIDPSHTEENR